MIISRYVPKHKLDKICNTKRYSGELFYGFDKNIKLLLKYEKDFKKTTVTFYLSPEYQFSHEIKANF